MVQTFFIFFKHRPGEPAEGYTTRISEVYEATKKWTSMQGATRIQHEFNAYLLHIGGRIKIEDDNLSFVRFEVFRVIRPNRHTVVRVILNPNTFIVIKICAGTGRNESKSKQTCPLFSLPSMGFSSISTPAFSRLLAIDGLRERAMITGFSTISTLSSSESEAQTLREWSRNRTTNLCRPSFLTFSLRMRSETVFGL